MHFGVHNAGWKFSNDGLLNKCKATLKYSVNVAEVDLGIKRLTIENE